MSSLLLSVSDLRTLLDSVEAPIVVDCRFSLADTEAGERDYRAGHLPGAFYLHLDRDLSGPKGLHGGCHPLPSAQAFAEVLAHIGWRPGRLLVAYDAQRGGFASRFWWLCRYFGIEQVALLDGGWGAWLAAGGALECGVSQVGSTSLPVLQADTRQVIEREAILAAQSDGRIGVLIDAREPARFRGEVEPIDPVAGCLPGAINRPWQEATDEQGFWRPAAEQAARFADLPDPLIAYCGSGVTACVNLFALALAGRSAQLYPGSWSDWCSYR